MSIIFKNRFKEEADNSEESESSEKRKNEEKFEQAEILKAKIKENPEHAIESEIFL